MRFVTDTGEHDPAVRQNSIRSNQDQPKVNQKQDLKNRQFEKKIQHSLKLKSTQMKEILEI